MAVTDGEVRSAATGRPQVVVIGGGFGGLAAVRAVRRAPVGVTWIDRRNHHLFQPLLYQVATAALSPADIAAPMRGIARGWRNVDVVLDRVRGIDPDRREVRTERQRFSYDHLVVATGAETSWFGHHDWAGRAFGLKSVEDAVAIRRRILLLLERAETATTEAECRRLLTYVLIGAGPTGVEMAGAIAELASHMLKRDFHHVDRRSVSVILIEAADQVLPGYPRDLAAYAEDRLRQMGVEVRTGVMVEEIEADGVIAEGEHIEASMVIWSAGVRATPVARWLRTEADEKGRVVVGPDLSVPGRPEIFVIGDAALSTDRRGDPLPGLAAVAKQQGTFVGRRIRDRVTSRSASRPFRYRDWGVLATIGRSSAVADLRRLRLTGLVAWAVWVVVHIWYLADFRNRIHVLINWMWLYLTFSPGARLITGNTSDADETVTTPAGNEHRPRTGGSAGATGE